MLVLIRLFQNRTKGVTFYSPLKKQRMAKWPNHFISDKQFHKRQNGNPDERDRERGIDSS